MTYTLWLHGHLLGETRLEHKGPGKGLRIGGLLPTAHGLETLPRLCGFIAAASAMKSAMVARGVRDAERDPDGARALLETTPEGLRFCQLVITLAELELREAGGERAPFHTLIITDLREIAELSEGPDAEPDAARELADGPPRYILSATRVDVRAFAFTHARPTRIRVRINPN